MLLSAAPTPLLASALCMRLIRVTKAGKVWIGSARMTWYSDAFFAGGGPNAIAGTSVSRRPNWSGGNP
ncbi:hypothetical protein D9M72_631580 [compost metagenome]